MADAAAVSDMGIEDDDEFAHLLDDDDDDAAAPSAKRVARYTAAASATSRLADDGDAERRLAQGIADESGGTVREPEQAAAAPAAAKPRLTDAERRDIEERLRAADEEPGPAALDAQQARRLAGAVARAHERNQLARSKHPDDPKRFMASELELHDAVRGMQELASAPELLGEVVACGGAEAALAVVGHPNGDVSVAALEFLDEALEGEADAGGAAPLATAVVRLGGCEAGVGRLWQLDATGDDDDAGGAQRALGVCEQLLAADASQSAPRLAAAGLLDFLLRRIQQPSAGAAASHAGSAGPQGEDEVLYQSADVLGLLLTSHPPLLASLPDTRCLPLTPRQAAQAAAGGGPGAPPAGRTPSPAPGSAVDGVEMLVRAAAAYRRAEANPESAAARECCEAVFQSLGRAASASGPGRAARRAALAACEGVELLVLVCQRPGLYARHCALVCLGEAVDGWGAGALSALRAGALGAVSAAFMGRAAAATARLAGRDAAAQEELAAVRVLSRAVAAVGSAAEGGATAVDRLRVVAKLLEDDGAKAARLVDATRDAWERVEAARGRAAAEAGSAAAPEVDLARMEAGLEGLALAASAVARLCELDGRVRARLLSRMAALRLPGAAVASALEEAVAVAGEDPAAMSRLAVMMRGFDAGRRVGGSE